MVVAALDSVVELDEVREHRDDKIQSHVSADLLVASRKTTTKTVIATTVSNDAGARVRAAS